MITFQFEAQGTNDQIVEQIRTYMEGFFGEEWEKTYRRQATIDVLVRPEAVITSDDGHHELRGYAADVTVMVT